LGASRRASDMEDTTMKNNTMMNLNNVMDNNTKVVNTFVLVNKGGMALLMNAKTGKYMTYTDEQGSTTMASMNLLTQLVSKFERTDNVLNIVIYSRNLCGTLKLDNPDMWIANGYQTEQGTQLTKEYCEMAKYVNDVRRYLGTQNLVCKAPNGGLVNANEKIAIDKAWKAVFNHLNTKPAKQYARKPEGDTKPALPSFVKVDESVEF
jgi:hypothetical protein